jgi:hypothetical protein
MVEEGQAGVRHPLDCTVDLELVLVESDVASILEFLLD